MVFFRIKKIKNNEYAYLVENEWMRHGSRQKVKDYLGRIYKFEIIDNINFADYIKIGDFQSYIENNDKTKIINDLIEWEIFRFGISKDEFMIDLNNKKIQKKKRNVALLVNDGFICSHTLSNLIDFKAEGDEQFDGYRFARAFVEAGIKVPQDIFVGLFGKIYKNSK